MLGINLSCIYYSFPAWWSPYSFGCNNTCWNLHFPIADGATRYVGLITPNCSLSNCTFWELSGTILSPSASFFGGSLIWVGNYFASSKCPFRYHASMFPFMCGSKGRRLVINLSYHTYILFISTHFLITLRTCFGLSHLLIIHFSQCQCGHTFDNQNTHLLRCL